MAQIDVMSVIDTQTIISTYGKNSDPNNPRQVSANMIYMVTRQGNALGGNGGGELNIGAETGDQIRWQATSATLDSEYNVIFYSFVATGGGNLISTPQANLAQMKTPLPNPQDPLHPTTQTVQVYYWSSNVNQPGRVTYHFNFMILDRHGNVQGYYWWDPFITISDD